MTDQVLVKRAHAATPSWPSKFSCFCEDQWIPSWSMEDTDIFSQSGTLAHTRPQACSLSPLIPCITPWFTNWLFCVYGRRRLAANSMRTLDNDSWNHGRGGSPCDSNDRIGCVRPGKDFRLSFQPIEAAYFAFLSLVARWGSVQTPSPSPPPFVLLCSQ